MTSLLVGYVAVRIFAAGPAATFLVSGGVLAGNAAITSSGSAIGGRMVTFGVTPAATPMPTPVPTPAPTPAPTPSGTSSCPLPKYPSPSCTGVPAGTPLTMLALNDGGAYRVTTAGQVIDGKHIAGSLLITANNVVVKNSQIDGTVINEYGPSHYSFTITDSTVGPASGCISAPGVGEAMFTATRVLVRGHDDGFRMSGNNVSVFDSYARLCWNPPSISPPDGSHSDGVQAYCPTASCSGLVMSHNTLDLRNISATFPINLEDTNISTVTLNDNLLGGGPYVIVTWWRSGSNWIVSNNRVMNGSWSAAPASAEGTCAHQTWSGNSIVNIDANYNVTSTVSALPCTQ